MFINLSNHPSDRWSEDQRKAAHSLAGYIQDLPFPQIDPNASRKDVERLALEYFEKIKKYACPVHVMGESTFVYHFVKLCEQDGIPCYASTTKRVAMENPDGSKTSVFEFVQFRRYF